MGIRRVSTGYHRKGEPGLKEAQERAMPKNLPYEQGYQKEELLCTESNAQPAVGAFSIRSDQRIGPVRTTASLNMEAFVTSSSLRRGADIMEA